MSEEPTPLPSSKKQKTQGVEFPPQWPQFSLQFRDTLRNQNHLVKMQPNDPIAVLSDGRNYFLVVNGIPIKQTHSEENVVETLREMLGDAITSYGGTPSPSIIYDNDIYRLERVTRISLPNVYIDPFSEDLAGHYVDRTVRVGFYS